MTTAGDSYYNENYYQRTNNHANNRAMLWFNVKYTRTIIKNRMIELLPL